MTTNRLHTGSKSHPLYSTWRSMKQRCTNPKVACFKHYGGSGIKVCASWSSDFFAFARDVGNRPEGKTLDRIDGTKDYEPGNVRWATQAEQLRNQKRNRILIHDGKSMCVADWAKELGCSNSLIINRIDKLGWPIEMAVTTKPRSRRA